MGDSHWYGDYVATVPFAGVRIRIVDFPGRTEDGQFTYECDVRRAADCPTTMEEVDAAFRAVLEQLPARDVHEIEWFD